MNKAEIESKIDKLEKAIKSPATPDGMKENMRIQVEKLRGQLKPEVIKMDGPSDPLIDKYKWVNSYDSFSDMLADKQGPYHGLSKAEKKKVKAMFSDDKPPQKDGSKKKKSGSKKKKPEYTLAGKKLDDMSCDELYAAVRDQHKKRQAAGRKSKPAIERVTGHIGGAVKTAVSAIAENKFDKNPAETIKQIQELIDAAENFMNKFKAVLGTHFSAEEVKEEISILEKFLKKLKEKHQSKK